MWTLPRGAADIKRISKRMELLEAKTGAMGIYSQLWPRAWALSGITFRQRRFIAGDDWAEARSTNEGPDSKWRKIRKNLSNQKPGVCLSRIFVAIVHVVALTFISGRIDLSRTNLAAPHPQRARIGRCGPLRAHYPVEKPDNADTSPFPCVAPALCQRHSNPDRSSRAPRWPTIWCLPQPSRFSPPQLRGRSARLRSMPARPG